MTSSSPFDVIAANDAGDYVLPFQFDNLPVRGRVVSLEMAVDTILGHHPYPPVVSRLLGEALAVTAGLASLLNFESAFTLQTSGDGFVPMLVCDATMQGGLRGYAQMRSGQAAFGNTLPEVLGRGHLAFTADLSGERYQGIVTLEGDNIGRCVEQYFRQSEQIQTYIRVAAGAIGAMGWKANALILQQMPPVAPASEIAVNPQETAEEGWRRLGMLLDTLSPEELLTTGGDSTLLLQRLFNEDEVRLFSPRQVKAHCRCSPERILGALSALPDGDIHEMIDDGSVTLTCEFCNKDFTVGREELQALLAKRE